MAIVVVYFGRMPMWAPAFFASARRNPDVHFLLYTDFEVPPIGADNIIVRRLGIPEFNQRASDILGTPIHVEHHLAKTNDLKPVYGLMFEEDLKPYAFWAYSDFDVVWGDVRRFVTDDILHAHDLISSRRDKLCGHFTMFRNTPEHNRTFELIPDVITAMGVPTHLHLDETVFTKSIRGRLGEWPLVSASRIYWKSEWTIDARYQRDMPDDAALVYRDGRTFDVEGQEMMYLHYHKLKQHITEINFGFADNPDAFTISRKGIYA